MRKDLSSFDFMFLVKELRELENSKVDKIYQDDNDFLFVLHASKKGKTMLRIILPKLMFITDNKTEYPEVPSEFCTFLRKRLTNSPLKKIEQVGQERILRLAFEGKEENFLIYIEMFSKGNLIFCNESGKILSLYERQEWGSRKLAIKETYTLPKQGSNTFEITEKEFIVKVKASEKDSIVKTLAIDFGLGGLFSEEVVVRAGIDKTKKDIGEDSTKRLYVALKRVLSEKITPIIYIKDGKEDEFSPITLKCKEGLEKKEFSSFSQLIENLSTTGIIYQKEEKRSKTKKAIEQYNLIISSQETTQKELDQSIEENSKKAELIYHNYSMIQDILSQINKAKETHSWKEIKEKLKEHKIVKRINEKEKTVVVEINS